MTEPDVQDLDRDNRAQWAVPLLAPRAGHPVVLRAVVPVQIPVLGSPGISGGCSGGASGGVVGGTSGSPA